MQLSFHFIFYSIYACCSTINRWADGYEKRFGLHYVDYTTLDRTRYPKDSARWYRDYIYKAQHNLIPPYKAGAENNNNDDSAHINDSNNEYTSTVTVVKESNVSLLSSGVLSAAIVAGVVLLVVIMAKISGK